MPEIERALYDSPRGIELRDGRLYPRERKPRVAPRSFWARLKAAWRG
jgi:hypothetical protein